LGWAWRTLVRVGEPDGNPAKVKAMSEAWLILESGIKRALRSGRNLSLAAGVEAKIFSTGRRGDLVQDLLVCMVEFLGRQQVVRDKEVARLELLAMGGARVVDAAGDEAWRHGTLSVPAEELERVWAAAGIGRELWAVRHQEGVEQGSQEGFWRGRLRKKVDQLLCSMLEKQEADAKNAEKLKCHVGATQATKGGLTGEAGTGPGPEQQAEVLSGVVIDTWFVPVLFPCALKRSPRKKGQIECFQVDFMAGGVGGAVVTTAWKRKSRRGRGAVCCELFWSAVELDAELDGGLPSALKAHIGAVHSELDGVQRALRGGEIDAEKADRQRMDFFTRWVAAVADEVDLVRASVQSIMGVVDALGAELDGAAHVLTASPGPELKADYVIAACHVMATRARHRRPSGMGPSGLGGEA
jgi:hypothetical protein